MRKMLLVSLSCLFITSCANPTYFNQNKQFMPVNWSKVLILPFSGDVRFTSAATDTLRLHILNAGNITFVKPPDLFQYRKLNQAAHAQIMGKIAKAEAVILGNVTAYNNGITLNGFATIKLIDTRTGEVVAVSHKPSGLLFAYSEHQSAIKAVERASKDILIALRENIARNTADGNVTLPEPTEEELKSIAKREPKSERSKTSEEKESVKATGTGFAISNDGRIITAYHVVREAEKIEVRFNDEEWVEAKLLKHSQANDIAILKIDKKLTSFLKVENTKVLELGDKVFTIGYPVIGVLGEEPKYTEGTVSSLSGVQGEDSLLQVSVPIQPGNSGGPLVDDNGDVVGLITSTAAIEYFLISSGSLPQNVNWAIKADYIGLMLNDIEISEPPMIEGSVVAKVKSSVCLIKVE